VKSPASATILTPITGSRSGFNAFEPRRRNYPRHHGFLISVQRSADVTPMSWSSASDIRASSPRSRSRLHHNCNVLRQPAKLGDDGPTAICGNAVRSMSFSWATHTHKATPAALALQRYRAARARLFRLVIGSTTGLRQTIFRYRSHATKECEPRHSAAQSCDLRLTEGGRSKRTKLIA
jgi:hypothetical protein